MNSNSLIKSKRNSSIELLKIFAIIGIIISHAMPYYDGVTLSNSVINIDIVTADVQTLIAFFLHNLGQIGNDVFVICSAWFLLESKNVKMNKAVSIIIDMFIVSVGFFIVFTALGYELPAAYIIKLFMPFAYSNNWFLTCYILLYLIHPLLNAAISALDKKGLLAVNMLFILLYVIRDSIDVNTLFYYSPFIGMIGLYFITAFFKRYLQAFYEEKKNCACLLLIGISLWIILNISLNFAGLRIGYFSDKLWQLNTMKNPAFILIALGAFGLAKSKSFYSKTINYFSSLSLFIYIIHANRIINDYLRYDIFKYVESNYSFNHILIWIFAYSAALLVFSTVLSVIYKSTVHKIVLEISNKIVKFAKKILLSDRIKGIIE